MYRAQSADDNWQWMGMPSAKHAITLFTIYNRCYSITKETTGMLPQVSNFWPLVSTLIKLYCSRLCEFTNSYTCIHITVNECKTRQLKKTWLLSTAWCSAVFPCRSMRSASALCTRIHTNCEKLSIIDDIPICSNYWSRITTRCCVKHIVCYGYCYASVRPLLGRLNSTEYTK